MKTLKKSHLTWLLHVQLTLLTGYLHTHTHKNKQTNKQKKEFQKYKTISSSLHMLQLLFETDNHNSWSSWATLTLYYIMFSQYVLQSYANPSSVLSSSTYQQTNYGTSFSWNVSFKQIDRWQHNTLSPQFWWPAFSHHLQSAGITEDVMRTECGSCSSHLSVLVTVIQNDTAGLLQLVAAKQPTSLNWSRNFWQYLCTQSSCFLAETMLNLLWFRWVQISRRVLYAHI